jgi:hypothetical protein
MSRTDAEDVIRYLASALHAEVNTSRTTTPDPDDAPARYWEGSRDAVDWVIQTLRGRAASFAAAAARAARLRQLATRASSGLWVFTAEASVHRHAEPGDWDTHERVGRFTDPALARYAVAAQPAVILRLLTAWEDPSADTGDLDALADAARTASCWDWATHGIYLHDREGSELGWMHRLADTDYLAAAHPRDILNLIDDVRALRAVPAPLADA